MGDSRFADTSKLPATEIHLNKDFICSENKRRTQQWTEFYSGPMYNNSAPQYPPPGYDNTYQYQYGGNYGYPGYGYQNQPVLPPGDTTYTHPGGGGGWTQQGGYSTAAGQQHQQPEPKMEVVQEMQQQKATLTKQREDYVKKALVLHRELDQLKQQKQELASNERSEKEHRSVLKENDRLQDEINSKLKAILNVIEMLSSIIKDGKKLSDLEADLQKPREEPPTQKIEDNSNQMEISKEWTRPSSRSDKESSRNNEKSDYKKERYSYIYYDTGLHWCRACDKFPETAKDFLQHLHADEHQEKAKENEVDTTPWHKLPIEPLLPSYDDAPKKRIPIKGLQFFISAPSWYCKLCDVWIGDLHCASHHLKSQAHFQNYENFVNENPQWEAQWLKDREMARARNEKTGGDSSDSDQERKKKKKKRNESVSKDKKKKKRSKKKKKRKKADSSDSSSSSSSSSDSSSDEEGDADQKDDQDTGKSIRVAMRNMQQVKSIMDEDMSKWSVLEKLMGDMKKPAEKPDETINQWMTVAQPVPEKEKNLLDSLKDRMKAKNDLEKARMAELDLRRREKEREDQEQERKRRQAREDAERAERERKRKEEEMNKVLDKERSHIRFRPRDQHGRSGRRRSSSPEHDRRDRSRHSRDSREREREQSPQFRPRRDYKASSPEKDSEDSNSSKRKPPGPPSYKKLPFIGRMPLFKKKPNNKTEERREISKAEYEPVRKTRFETGMLARAFIPRPDVVCFPVLSTIPPMMAPPEPTAVEQTVEPMKPEVVEAPPPPPPPKVSKVRKEEVVAPPPPPPPENNHDESMQEDYYQNMYETSHYETAVPHPPLEPPPLPPDDDLAMLGICADDMAAQSF